MKEKILIALGDKNLSNIIIQNLNKIGHVTEQVDSGLDVISKMKIFKPDLLLIDTVLPGKTGYEILNEKSFDKDITKIPVIIISNNGAPIQMRQIPATPMIKDYIIRFHVEPTEVIEKIEKAFGRTPIVQKQEPVIIKNNKKVLWVEDDKLLGKILSKKIEQSGFTLLKAENGEEAFKILDTETPDLIMLDILLPEMSGLDILQKIKMNEKNRKIPSIILSNLSKQSDKDKAKLLGANKFIVKATSSLDEIISEMSTLAGVN